MAAPHIRDLNLPDWHEVPETETIPAGTRYIVTTPHGRWTIGTDSADLPPIYREPAHRYFTAEPISYTREEEIEAETVRLIRVAIPDIEDPWKVMASPTRGAWFRRLATDSLDRQASS